MKSDFSRRRFLKSAMLLAVGAGANRLGLASLGGIALPGALPAGGPSRIEVSGAIQDVHDPVIIRTEDAYYLFVTGDGIPLRKSKDMRIWSRPFPPLVFGSTPDWAREMIPGAIDIWAPDISFYNGKYHLYYAVSTFGSNRSVIGLATNTTLDYAAGGYEWVDEGLVIESTGMEDYNCIDPNLVLDEDGVPWLAFGSFWSGLKMRRLDYDTGKLSSEDDTLYSLAGRSRDNPAIEAPFIIHHGDYYYLFASFDQCCQGADSTYYVVVGRSENVTGPYADKNGVPMMEGGGTQVTFPTERWRGPGHNAVLQDVDGDYIVYHAYDALMGGARTLRIDELLWDAEDWPYINVPED